MPGTMLAFHYDLKRAMWSADFMDRYAAALADWRYNTVLYEAEDKLRFSRHPTIAHADAISAEETRARTDALRRRGFQIIPLVQSLGHADYVLTKPAYEHLRESPKHESQYDPLSEEARRFHKRGPSFLQRYLPFWAATQLDRLKVMLLPLVALLIPLIKIMPPLYRWRMRARIYPWYRDVLAIDRRAHRSEADITRSLADLETIEQEVAKISIPLSFAEELYDLRLHIGMIRERLEKRLAG